MNDDNKLMIFLLYTVIILAVGFLNGYLYSYHSAKMIGYREGYKEGLKHVE